MSCFSGVRSTGRRKVYGSVVALYNVSKVKCTNLVVGVDAVQQSHIECHESRFKEESSHEVSLAHFCCKGKQQNARERSEDVRLKAFLK